MRSILERAVAGATIMLVAGCGDSLPTAEPQLSEQLDWSVPAAAEGWITGSVTPDLKGYDVNDDMVALSDFSGSFVLLEVGGGWCAPTQSLAPILPRLEEALWEEGIPFATTVALVESSQPGSPSTSGYVDGWLDHFYDGDYRTVLHMNGDAAVAESWYDLIAGFPGIPVLLLLGPERQVISSLVGAAPEEYLLTWIRASLETHFGPEVGEVEVPEGLVAVGSAITVSGTFMDSDSESITGSIYWDDGVETALVIHDDGTFSSLAHAFDVAGDYYPEITLVDEDGNSTLERLTSPIRVVDPDGGFVTGAGSVQAPGCLDEECESIGEVGARIRVRSMYVKRTLTPTGRISLELDDGTFAFESTSQEWMRVDPATATVQVRGTGTFGGTLGDAEAADGTYRFYASATDGAEDTFALDIVRVDEEGRTLVYSTGGPVALTSGNIVVHTR